MNKTKILVLSFIFLIAIFYFPLLKADVVSINSGGSESIVVNSNNYIEGFFSCVPTTCAKLGYNCDSWDDRCGKTINCGACSSGYICSAGICTGTVTSTSGGGGAGGAGGAISGITPGIVITPSAINLTLSYNNVTLMSQRVTQIFYITNTGATSQTLSVSQTGLSSVAIFDSTPILVDSGKTAEFKIDFVAPLEQKDISGQIIIDGKSIPVFLHVTSNPLWFDSNIIVLNKDYKVSRGGTLKTSVGLIPQGEKSRLDVTLNYEIKDVSGKIYLTKSETVLVTDKMDFERDFGTGMLPAGSYIITLDLVYPGGVAPSSARFEVVPMTAGSLLGAILFFLIFLILVVAIIIIIILIRRKRRENHNLNV